MLREQRFGGRSVKAPFDRRGIEKLIGAMTLKEKLGQLTMLSGELVQTGPASAPVTSA